jgi:endo-1,4-beta-mannosidase
LDGGSVRIARNGDVLLVNGGFRFLLGVNYWPRKLGVRMWRGWDEAAIMDDAKVMRELGVVAARVFVKNEDFADEDATPYPDMLLKLKRLLDILGGHDVAAFITLLVGHMSGKNWRIPWLRFEELYKPHTIRKTVKFIETLVRELKDHPAVAGWILSNEVSLTMKAGSREEAISLLKIFSETVRSIDGNHAISSGDIPDGFMQETPNVAGLVDYVGPHLYIYDSDHVRHGYMYGALLELYSNSGEAPVILEEFGFSTYQFSEESQARFINEVLYTALAHRASGVFIWCFSDFMCESDPPYEWKPLELAFGIIRGDGSRKPAADVVKRFAGELEKVGKLNIYNFKRNPPLSIVVPFYMFRDYEFVRYRSILGFWGMIRPAIASSIIASSSGLDNTLIYELDMERVFGDRRLLLMPSVIVALTSTWRRLLEYVEGGGGLYVSLTRGFGDFMARHEAATHLWTELMGIENTLEAGSPGVKYYGTVAVKFVRDFGLLKKGDRITLHIHTPIYTYSAEAVDAEVIAVDEDGCPVLFKAGKGKGIVVTSMIPIELVEALAEKVDWSGQLQKLYRSVAGDMGVEVSYEASSPEVEVKVFYGDSSDIIVAVNHGDWKKVFIASREAMRNVAKLGGDAAFISWSSYGIKVEMPKKSGLILHVEK